jgi:hypothetical protein
MELLEENFLLWFQLKIQEALEHIAAVLQRRW